MKLKCVIVDDEKLAIVVVESYLKKIPNIEIAGQFQNVTEVYGFLQENHVDLLLLDIEMPELSGIDFVKSLNKKPYIIFITAKKEYAIEGFELKVTDYIIKPVTFERILKSINYVFEQKAKDDQKQDEKPKADYIFLKENKKNVKVKIKSILYLESIKDYIRIVTKDKVVTTKQQIGYFEDILDKTKFLRIHRSFIVATDHIDAYSCSGVDIVGQEIPIGRKYKDEVIEKLDKLNLTFS